MATRRTGAFLLLAWAACVPAPPESPANGDRAGQSPPSDRRCTGRRWQAGWLEIHHIDAGESVSTLIVNPTGRSLLVDAGEASWEESQGARCIGSYVTSVLGHAQLDYLVISHFHLDHAGFPGYGGVWHLLHEQGFRVGKLLHRDLDRIVGAGGATLEAWRTFLHSGDGLLPHREVVRRGSGQVDLGRGVRCAFVAVDGNGILEAGDPESDPTPADENDFSVALLLRMGRLDYFSAGDLPGKAFVSAQGHYAYHDLETPLAPSVKDVDVYRASHHGSAFSSNRALLAEIDPEVSIIQVSDTNQDGHPAQSTVDRLAETSALYLTEGGDSRTDLRGGKVLGHVVVRTLNGIDYTVGDDAFVASDPERI